MNQGFPPYQVQLLLLLTIVSVISGQDVSYKHTLTWWVFKRMKKNRRRFQTGETKAMAPYCSTLAWKIPWTEEPSGLQSMGSRRVGHHWATSLSCIGEGNGSPLSVLAWRIPGTGAPGGLPSMGSHRVGHDWRDLAAAAAAVSTWGFSSG